jgi:hypothetical protein
MIDDAIRFLKNYNQWRRGVDGIEQPNPKDIGNAIDAIVDYYEAELMAEELKPRNVPMLCL